MPNPSHISIMDTFGVLAFLDATPDAHNGLVGADFKKDMEREPRPPDTELAPKYGVTSMTIGTWRRNYFKRKEKK